MILGDRQMVRFENKIDRSPHPKGCWIWLGSTNPAGYGQFWVSPKAEMAHRVSFSIHKQVIPSGKIVCHHCDNPSCVNPDHLFMGTHLDNVMDKIKKGRHNPATGDRSGARKHPERMARWHNNGPHMHPERMARGDSNGARKYPERLTRGVNHHSARVTPDEVVAIRISVASGAETYASMAGKYGVSNVAVRKIVQRRSWKHVP